MKTAVQIGAGNIGRGFMGQIFFDSGYRTVFIDIDRELIDAINAQGSYTIELVDNSGRVSRTISRISGVWGSSHDEAVRTLAGADIISISVGVSALEKVAVSLAEGFRLRWERKNFVPINVLICENLMDAPGFLRGIVKKQLSPVEERLIDRTVGFVETSIGRMVPGGDQGPNRDSLTVRVEPYCRLPVDRNGFVGEIPDLKYLETFSPFRYYIQRKLYVHNAGHAVLAYLGFITGKVHIWESMADRTIRSIFGYTMDQVAHGLVKENKADLADIRAHIADLQERFSNRALGDTVIRVGRDPRRKLGPEDRIIGAFRLLHKYHLDTSTIPLIIAAGLLFCPEGDQGGGFIQALIAKEGIEAAARQICGLDDSEAAYLLPRAAAYYRQLKNAPEQALRQVNQDLPISR